MNNGTLLILLWEWCITYTEENSFWKQQGFSDTHLPR